MTAEQTIICPLCGTPNPQVFYHQTDVPTSCNRLWRTKKEAINCIKGTIKLAFCPTCTYISNIAIEPQKNQYDSQYDNSLYYSQRFQDFAKSLATTLIKRYNLYNKKIVEVTVGKVNFLSFFKELGPNQGISITPTSIEENNVPINADFIFSYHELEHQNNPKLFVSNLREIINKESSVFLAVPNSLRAFAHGEYTDIIYEHVSYFTIPSLYKLFLGGRYKIKNEKFQNSIFDSIYIESTPNKTPNITSSASRSIIKKIQNIVLSFASRTEQSINKKKQLCTNLLDKNKKIVVWGAGARGVTFLNILNDQRIEYAVDINPNKQAMYVPGTGQKIVAPDFLRKYQPNIILLANPAYKKEIKQTIDNLGADAKFVSI